ncbi:MAG: hypothetical protein COA74_11340 [Gammaproteobacteria bacterium]|nr:MAG: hypothetical protein COA74_11340 [Gammaproteobacteria bacterium]
MKLRLKLPKVMDIRLTGLLISSLLVSACGGGGGEGVGGGTQQPDSVVQDLPIIYVKRTIPVDDLGAIQPQDLRNPIMFNPGAELLLRALASPTAAETSLTTGLFAEGELIDIKDLAVSSDGTRLIFALRAPELEGVDDDEQPTWNIWQYQLESQQLSRIISSDLNAEQGQDMAPAFLPDGRIVFSSTRQRSNKSTLLDEGKPQFSGLEEDRQVEALVLHVMDEDGGNIQQITFNQSHDLDPTVMLDGKIVFTRWDNMANRNGFNLYRVDPDGRNMEFLYGNHSHQTGTNNNTIQFTQPMEMPSGQLLTMTRATQSSKLSADLTQIDVVNFTENDQASFSGSGSSALAQTSMTPDNVSNDDSEISVGGYYASAFPLWDGSNRILISWSACRLSEVDANNVENIVACTEDRLVAPDVVEAMPLFGVWMMSVDEGTILPIVTGEEGFMYTDLVALQPRATPTFIADGMPGVDLEQSLVDERVGVIHIRSVYDFDGIDITADGIVVMADPLQTTATQRTARFLRIVKAVSMPDDDLVDLDGSAFGRSNAQLMREILGYVPVEPDGSVKFKVPANVSIAISVLDEQGRRLTPRHQNWLQVKPGEQLDCSGCHTGDSSLPHGRIDAQAPSINLGAAITGLPFPNTEPGLFADEGETMAETYSRINGVRTPSVDIQFDDDWTDETLRPKDLSFSYNYSDLTTQAPTSFGCMANWVADCRITINYVDVIQPIWELSREVFDVDGITVIQDNTCIACHGLSDNLGQAQVPFAQLDLSSTASTDDPDLLTSYRELFFNDNAQEIMNDAILDQLIPLLDANGDPVFEVDANGDLILDANGDPIPVLVTVGISPALRVAGALASSRLFDLFAPSGTHFGRLSDAELKLIAEWLDIGGQNYNNPFDVPPN